MNAGAKQGGRDGPDLFKPAEMNRYRHQEQNQRAHHGFKTTTGSRALQPGLMGHALAQPISGDYTGCEETSAKRKQAGSLREQSTPSNGLQE